MENEKPSRQRQWQERSDRPIAARPMSKAQIEEFRQHLAMSYKCDVSDITFDFERIFDENDEDRDDCLWLKYKINTIWHGKPTNRNIYTIKLPIPKELRMMAEQHKQQGAKNQRTKRNTGPALAITQGETGTAPSSGIKIEEIIEPESGAVPTPIVRPKLKIPVRKPKA